MTSKAPVVIVDYDPAWPVAFAALARVLSQAFGELALSIEHVGSTAVPGLAAKPVIDLDVVISAEERLPAVDAALMPLGYEYEGEKDIPGRHAFDRRGEDVPRDGSRLTWPAHHLYVCARGCTELRRHLAFRDYLRSLTKCAPHKAANTGIMQIARSIFLTKFSGGVKGSDLKMKVPIPNKSKYRT